MIDQFEIIDTWVTHYKRPEEGRGPVSGEIWKVFEDTIKKYSNHQLSASRPANYQPEYSLVYYQPLSSLS